MRPAFSGSYDIGAWQTLRQEARSGFEPLLGEDDDDPPLGREAEARPASELPADLQRIVERLTRGSARAERE
jgi:hypothetical protein